MMLPRSNPSPSAANSAIRWITIAACLGLLLVVFVQRRTVAQLRHENELLRVQPHPLPSDVPKQATASAVNPEDDAEQLQNDRLELLRLRNEVRQLREQAPGRAAQARPAASQPVAASAPPTPSREREAQQLGVAAMQGDATALDKLSQLATAARTMDTNEQEVVYSDLRHTFEALGAEAGKGNAAGLRALWQASRMPELQGFAVAGLGQAASQGNEEALKPLLDPESYLLTRSSAVSALKLAADAGNARAIEALAATARDPDQRPLWLLAANGLAAAAAAGNGLAIDGLAGLAADENRNVQKTAVLALEAAARNNQPRAEEALRKLGWR